MKGLDTNVLIRYLVQDDPLQSALATEYVETQCTVDNPCFINQIVLSEMVWVLESNYQQTRDQIATVIEQLLQVGQLEVMESDVVWRALADYKNSNADFPDHLVARINEYRGCNSTLTFDKKDANQSRFELLK